MAAPVPFPELPGIDAQVGLSFSAGSPEIYLRVLGRFRDAKATAAGDLRRVLAEGDRETAGRLAHTLKSAAMAIGAVALSEAARDLEGVLLHGEGGGPADLLVLLEERLEVVVDGLRSGLA